MNIVGRWDLSGSGSGGSILDTISLNGIVARKVVITTRRCWECSSKQLLMVVMRRILVNKVMAFPEI
ncbi:hypothetical protein C0J52_27266 [Blattella germanica]|nr:hypothetical protein C0J52_27266 [Blattella germanica]